MVRTELPDRSELETLVDELDQIEEQNTGVEGYSPADKTRLLEIERRLVELLSADSVASERRQFLRLPCDLQVTLRISARATIGQIADIGVGGVLVRTMARAAVGDPIQVEIPLLDQSLSVKGRVAWVQPDGRALGVAFQAADDDERHLRRFMLALLRKHLPFA